jgi:hypothetical protein
MAIGPGETTPSIGGPACHPTGPHGRLPSYAGSHDDPAHGQRRRRGPHLTGGRRVQFRRQGLSVTSHDQLSAPSSRLLAILSSSLNEFRRTKAGRTAPVMACPVMIEPRPPAPANSSDSVSIAWKRASPTVRHFVMVGGVARNGRTSSHSWIGFPPAPGGADNSPASSSARS